jgi:hypothetical protein
MTRLLNTIFLRLMPLLLTGVFLLPQALPAQTTDPDTEEVEEGGDKEKKEKKKKEKAPKEKKEKKAKEDEEGGGDDGEVKRASGDQDAPKDLNGGVDDTTRVSVSCLRYKTGYMEYIDKNYHGVKVKRKGKKEIWNNTIDGNKLTFKIEWLAHNHYVLRFVKGKLPSRFKKGYVLDCTMIACYDEYYDCDCLLNGIRQYGSVNKTPTKQEIAARERADREKLEKAEAARAKFVADSTAKANAPVIDPDAPPAPTPPPAEAKTDGSKADKGSKGDKAEKPAKGDKPAKEKKAKKEKAPKEKKEKPEKAPKEPKEKKEKPEKPVKEKKVKEDDLQP